MTNKLWHHVRHMSRLYEILYDISEDFYNEWPDLSDDELVKIVMRRSRGQFNPAQIKQIIEENK